VGDLGVDLLGPIGLQGGSRLEQGAAAVQYVVHEDAGAVLHFADKTHAFNDIVLPLVAFLH